MSVNIATEVRRISDARTRLKAIIDMQAQANAAQLSPDDFKYQTNATLAQATKNYTDDVTVDAAGGQTASALQMPLSPLEPDLTTLTIWMPLTNLGNQADLALMGNSGAVHGGCTLVSGPPGCDNKMLGGGTDRAVFFDGYTSYLDVPDNAEIRMPAAGGFSYCCRINIKSSVVQLDNTTHLRTIAAKTDDSSNSWEILVSTSNEVVFHVKTAGSTYKIKTAPLSLNTWYDIVATFALTGPVLTLYANNVSSTTADYNAVQYPASTDLDLHIGRSDNTIIPGNEYGLGGAFDSYAFDDIAFDTDDYLLEPTTYSLALAASYITFPYSAVIDNLAAFTISCWVKMPVGTGGGTFIQKGWGSNGSILMYCNGTNGYSLDIINNSGTSFGTGAGFTPADRWHHVVFVYTGAQILCYMDNVASAPTAAVAGTLTLNAGLSFGNFTGSLADVRVYNDDLTSTEVSNLYNGLDVTRAIVARFPFVECGLVTLDTVNAIQGTIPNPPGGNWSTDLPAKLMPADIDPIPHSTINGGFWGAMHDPRFYNVVLSSTQVGYLYTNKFSISNIGLGGAAIAGYCVSHS